MRPLLAKLTPLAVALAAGLSACGTTSSSAGFSGEKHAVAQTIVNLQSDATSGPLLVISEYRVIVHLDAMGRPNDTVRNPYAGQPDRFEQARVHLGTSYDAFG